jgi:RHS repeat-associated protein
VTKEDGNLVYQVRYWAYGEIRGRFNSGGNPIAANPDYRYEFTGHETEFASELAYAGARFYDPEIAQFLTHDPAGEFASPYAYGPGNPVNGADPTGAAWAELESASSGGGSAETDASGGDSGESVGGGNVGGGAKKTQAPVEQKSPPPTKTSEKAAEHTGDGLAAGSGGKGAAAAAKGVSERAAHGSGDVRDVVNGESSQQTKFDRFFETHYDAAAVMAAEYGFDATLALAVAAKESDWGTSPMAVEHNNPFGFTPGGQGSRPVHFDSVSEAWQAWGKQWGPRVAYVGSNVERFVSSLQADNRFVYGPTIGGDRRGRYNTESMDTWGPSMPAIIRSVQTRLHQWSGYGP